MMDTRGPLEQILLLNMLKLVMLQPIQVLQILFHNKIIKVGILDENFCMVQTKGKGLFDKELIRLLTRSIINSLLLWEL